MSNTATISINGQPVTIEINITSSDETKPEGAGRTDIDGFIDDGYSMAPLKRASDNKWTNADLEHLRAGTYIQSKAGDTFFKVGDGDGQHWIDKSGNVLSSAEVSFVIRNAFNLRNDIYFVTFSTDKATSGAKIA